MGGVGGGSGLSVAVPSSSSALSKLRKQTLDLTHSGVAGQVISAKKLWRSGMMKLWSLRNAFAGDGSDVREGDEGAVASAAWSDEVWGGGTHGHGHGHGHSGLDSIGTGGAGAARGDPSLSSSASTARMQARSALKELAHGLANGSGGLGSSSSAARDRDRDRDTASAVGGGGSSSSSAPNQWLSLMSEHAALTTEHQTLLERAGRPEGSTAQASIQLRPHPDDDQRWTHLGEVAQGCYAYLHLALTKSRAARVNQLRIQLAALNTAQDELEVFLCTSNRAPSRHRHSWKMSRKQKMLLLSKHDPRFAHGNGHLYIGASKRFLSKREPGPVRDSVRACAGLFSARCAAHHADRRCSSVGFCFSVLQFVFVCLVLFLLCATLSQESTASAPT